MELSRMSVMDKWTVFWHGIARMLDTVPTPLFIALIFVGIFIILMIIQLRRSVQQNKSENTTVDPESNMFKLPTIGGVIGDFLMRRGKVKVGQISANFLKALRFNKLIFQGQDAFYQLPWYFIVGSEQSGKSTLFEASGLSLPLGRADFSSGEINPRVNWWFLDQGIFIEPRGDDIQLENGQLKSGRVLQTLVNLLKRYRTARPINGIVLTIPVTELYGLEDNTLETLHQRAMHMAYSLAQTQRQIGLKLPVYVIITKTDLIPGFQDLCARIPSFHKQDMLGWSNPHPLENTYQEQWVNDAFDEISVKLHHLRLMLFASYADHEHNDGVFLFPKEILTLKKTLKLYLNTIFNATAFNEGLMFRGFYFTGSAQGFDLPDQWGHSIAHDQEEENNEDVTRLEVNADNTQQPHSRKTFAQKVLRLHAFTKSDLHLQEAKYQKKIVFAQHIFQQKIFYEPGLATPLKRYASSYKTIKITQTVLGVFFIVGCFGLFNAYNNFVVSRNNIRPALSNMKNVLMEITAFQKQGPKGFYKTVTQGQTNLFALHTQQVIDMMIQLENANMFSIFVPASWISSIDSALKKSLKIAFREIILRTIKNGLAVKAHDLLQLSLKPEEKTYELSDLMMPTRLKQFQIVENYVQEMQNLFININKLQTLKLTGEPALLRHLVRYVFKTDLPANFWNHYDVFKKVLRSADVQPFYMEELRTAARLHLNTLYQEFLTAIFMKNAQHSLAGQLTHLVDTLDESKPLVPVDLNYLKSSATSLRPVIPYLGEKGQTWLDKPYCDLGERYRNFLDAVASSYIFGKKVAQFLITQTETGFQTLKQHMLTLQETASHGHTPVKGAHPSDLIFQLDAVMGNIFSKAFMQPSKRLSIVNVIPNEKYISFDPNLVEVAFNFTQEYANYIGKTLTTIPKQYHKKLKEITAIILHENLKNVLSNAQTLEDVPNSYLINDLENFVLAKSQQLHHSAHHLHHVFEVLHEHTNDPFVTELTVLLASSAKWLLGACEKFLHQANPFAIRDFEFTWWNGEKGAAFNGYSVRDELDLKNYFATQLETVSKIGLHMAKPAVEILSTPFMQRFVKLPVLSRWRTLVEQLTLYEKQAPGNSVKALEDFVLKDFVHFTTYEALQFISIDTLFHESTDFFLETLRALKKGMRSRAEVLQRTNSIQAITTLFKYFNENLKDKFPFASSSGQIADELDPDQLREFYRLYTSFGGKAKVILDQVYQLGGKADAISKFFLKMDRVKEFFETYLDPNSGVYIPTFNFNIEFRVNRTRETEGDLIADWIFKPDPLTKVTRKGSKHSGQWVYGNEVSFQFRWPHSKQLPSLPVNDPDQPELQIKDQTAIFTYTGPWALLWALRVHQAPVSETDGKKTNNALLLKFTVPTNNNKKTVLYNTISLIESSSDAKSPGKRLQFPVFPDASPTLDPALIGLSKHPVFTTRKAKMYEMPTDMSEPGKPVHYDRKVEEIIPAATPAPAPPKNTTPPTSRNQESTAKPSQNQTQAMPASVKPPAAPQINSTPTIVPPPTVITQKVQAVPTQTPASPMAPLQQNPSTRVATPPANTQTFANRPLQNPATTLPSPAPTTIQPLQQQQFQPQKQFQQQPPQPQFQQQQQFQQQSPQPQSQLQPVITEPSPQNSFIAPSTGLSNTKGTSTNALDQFQSQAPSSLTGPLPDTSLQNTIAAPAPGVTANPSQPVQVSDTTPQTKKSNKKSTKGTRQPKALVPTVNVPPPPPNQ